MRSVDQLLYTAFRRRQKYTEQNSIYGSSRMLSVEAGISFLWNRKEMEEEESAVGEWAVKRKVRRGLVLDGWSLARTESVDRCMVENLWNQHPKGIR